jgi:hypothetical protein
LIPIRDKVRHPVPGGYKYGDLALQVGGVSDETVKYGLEFCGTVLARTSSNSKLHTRPLVREGAKLSKHFKEIEKSVVGPRWVSDNKTDLPTDCRS